MPSTRFFKHLVKKFCAAVAANTGILYSLTNVGVEAKGQLAINNGPGDIADLVEGKKGREAVCHRRLRRLSW